jgi:fructokinase
VAVAVVDTVGAGDTFQAALLAALAERGLLEGRAHAMISAC